MPARQTRLVDRVERRIETLVRTMVDAFVGEIPIYAKLPAEQLSGDIEAIVRQNLRIFFRCVRENRGPSAAELGEPRASAARRAEERVPLDSVLTAYHLGARLGWKAIVAEAQPDEQQELPAIAEGVLVYIQALTSAVSSAYVEEQQLIYGEERDARRALTEALLSGGPDGATLDDDALGMLARRAGARLADAYLVLVLRLGPSSDELDSGVVPAVASRRKLRRVQAQLDTLAGESVLTLFDPDRGWVLFPLLPQESERALAESDELVGRLAKAAEADVTAGVSCCSGPAGTASAATEAKEVLDLAVRLERPPGAYRLDDVLLEHTLTHPPETASRLVRLLDPLTTRPDLIETLERWFAADFDRRAAAAALNVHPNTLDYRLRRIAELTQVDLASAHGMQLLGAALTARRCQ